MDPRFIIKTHTAALRPGNYSLLISRCTFPDESAHQETIERRLADYLGKSVAKYTVLTATRKNRGFGFLLDNMIWSWRGHVINTVLKYRGKSSDVAQDYFSLSQMEKIAYLKYFLETEGALILVLGNRFRLEGKLSYDYLKGEIQNIFNEIYQGYIDIAPDLRSRVRIKEMLAETERRKKSKQKLYDPGTLAHKIKPHIEAFSDLGLLTTVDEESYAPASCNGVLPLVVISESLENFAKMEEVFSSDGYFLLIAKALNLNIVEFSTKSHRDMLEETLFLGYETMSDKTTGMAEIDALVDWIRIKLLSENNVLAHRQDVEDLFSQMRKDKPSKVRYHVDGKGRVAYVILEL